MKRRREKENDVQVCRITKELSDLSCSLAQKSIAGQRQS